MPHVEETRQGLPYPPGTTRVGQFVRGLEKDAPPAVKVLAGNPNTVGAYGVLIQLLAVLLYLQEAAAEEHLYDTTVDMPQVWASIMER